MTPDPKTPEPSAEELRQFVDHIADQRLQSECDPDTADYADYEGAYEQIVEAARALKRRLTSEPAERTIIKEVYFAKAPITDEDIAEWERAAKDAKPVDLEALDAKLRESEPAASVGVTRGQIAAAVYRVFRTPHPNQNPPYTADDLKIADAVVSLLASSPAPTLQADTALTSLPPVGAPQPAGLPEEIEEIDRDSIAQIIEQGMHGIEWTAGKRPSIAELEAILNSDQTPSIQILPDGSITTGPPREAAFKCADDVIAFIRRQRGNEG